MNWLELNQLETDSIPQFMFGCTSNLIPRIKFQKLFGYFLYGIFIHTTRNLVHMLTNTKINVNKLQMMRYNSSQQNYTSAQARIHNSGKMNENKIENDEI